MQINLEGSADVVEMEEIDEILNEICFAPVPYQNRVEMCAAVVKAVREAVYEEGVPENYG